MCLSDSGQYSFMEVDFSFVTCEKNYDHSKSVLGVNHLLITLLWPTAISIIFGFKSPKVVTWSVYSFKVRNRLGPTFE